MDKMQTEFPQSGMHRGCEGEGRSCLFWKIEKKILIGKKYPHCLDLLI